MITWWLEWGERVDDLERLARQGKTIPALQNRPELTLWLVPAFDCYADLNGVIAWPAVKAWADYHQQPFDALWAVLRIAERRVAQWHKTRSAYLSQDQKRSAKAS